MRDKVIDDIKTEIEKRLKEHLRNEGIELLVAANKNTPEMTKLPLVILEGIEDMPLEGKMLRWEIRVILAVLGKAWQCDKLIEGMYHALSGYGLTTPELAALLMSIHIETTHCIRPRLTKKCAVIRYIMAKEA